MKKDMNFIPLDAMDPKDIKLVVITPELAAKWLGHNYFNRSISERTVREYMFLMKNGYWGESDSLIVLAANGTVLNGQHRLIAIVRTGITITAFVRFNASYRQHLRFDHGHKRTLLDVFRLEYQCNTIRGKEIEVLKAVVAGLNCRLQDYTYAEDLFPYYEEYGTLISLLIDTLGEKFDTTALGVLVKAVPIIGGGKVSDFCDLLLGTDSIHPSKGIVQQYLAWLSQQRNRREATRREIYKWTQFVLKAVMEEKDTCEIPSVAIDLFPLKTPDAKSK
ncbi:MAG: hypothetical protein PHQ75_14355 [Thermoguttaceae bacterium]|nr:hypothetical protein [Thermoguttaceae bacterium]